MSPAGRIPAIAELHSPRGVLEIDEADGTVRCHLCGRWFRALTHAHLWRRHGVDADDYRRIAGLRPRQPLNPPALSARRARQLKRRLETDPVLQAASSAAHDRARRGDIQRLARALHDQRGLSPQRAAQLAVQGSELGAGRAERFRAGRERRARALGHPDLEAYYRRRYIDDRARLVDLAAELGVAESAVRGDLRRLGLGPLPRHRHG